MKRRSLDPGLPAPPQWLRDIPVVGKLSLPQLAFRNDLESRPVQVVENRPPMTLYLPLRFFAFRAALRPAPRLISRVVRRCSS